jgi:hypothetical protein
MTYSARVKNDQTNVLVMHVDDIMELSENLPDLFESISQTKGYLKDEERFGMPTLDYQVMRNAANLDMQKLQEKKSPLDIFQHCVNKMMTIKRFQRKKEFRFTDLVKYLKG